MRWGKVPPEVGRHLDMAFHTATLISLAVAVGASVATVKAASRPSPLNASGCKPHIEPGVPDIECDSERIAEMLANLLANALRHTPTGGRVDLSARRHDALIEIAANPSRALPGPIRRASPKTKFTAKQPTVNCATRDTPTPVAGARAPGRAGRGHDWRPEGRPTHTHIGRAHLDPT